MNIRDILEIETRHSATGMFPDPQTTEIGIYLAQIKDCNARKAEALAAGISVHPLLLARTALFRGKMKDAESLLSQMECGDSMDKAELLLERARLMAFEGDWAGTEKSCREALETKPAPLSILTLHQVLALALFELGEMSEAMNAIEVVESMATLFPDSVSVFYARILRARVIARDMGDREARSLLESIWHDTISRSEPSIDEIQALLRTEIDLRRLANRPFLEYAVAAFLLADSVGEGLYSALALVDCASASHALEIQLSNRLQKLTSEFVRVANFRMELLDSTKARSSSAIAHLSYLKFDEPGINANAFEHFISSTHIFLTARQVLIIISPFSARPLKGSRQFCQALTVLSDRLLSKENFFRAIWGTQKYVPRLHDPLIWSLLHRINKSLGIWARIEDEHVSLSGVLVVK